MTDLAIRLTFCYTEVQEIIEQFSNNSEGCVVYEHEKDDEVSRTHVHMYLHKCKVSTDTLKNYIRRKKGQVEKTDWSFKTAESDPTKYITYMSKGVLTPVYFHGYLEAYIDECKRRWVDPTVSKVKLSNGKLVKEIDDSSNISKRQLVEEMVANIGDSECDTRVILDGIRKVLIQHRIVVGMYKVMDYYDSYIMYSQKQKWIEMIASKIDKRNS